MQVYRNGVEGVEGIAYAMSPALSPDGTRAVIEARNAASEGSDLWLVDLETEFVDEPGIARLAAAGLQTRLVLVRVVREYDPVDTFEARDICKWYIHRLRRKIETDPASPVYIHTVWGEGYRFSPGNESRPTHT